MASIQVYVYAKSLKYTFTQNQKYELIKSIYQKIDGYIIYL